MTPGTVCPHSFGNWPFSLSLSQSLMCSRPAPSWAPCFSAPWTPRALPCSPPRLQVPPCPRCWSSVSHKVCSVLHEHQGCKSGFLLGRRWPGLRLWAWNYRGVLTERRNQPLPAPAWLQEGRVTLQPTFSHAPCGHEYVCRRACTCRSACVCMCRLCRTSM